MPPKLDINKTGWEQVEFPALCESCLGSNPYIRMTKENYGDECKICTRPTTAFKWMPEKESRFKKTQICMTCSRLKNCCQGCLLDLQFGLPIQIRDAALNLVAQGPNSHLNREFYAQNMEKQLTQEKEQGQIAPPEYDKADSAARTLLQKLSKSEPYYKRDRPYPCTMFAKGHCPRGDECQYSHDLSDYNTGYLMGEPRKRSKKAEWDNAGDGRLVGGRSMNRGEVVPVPVGPIDLTPPKDQKIMSLFLTGVEDDLPQHEVHRFFSQYGSIRSIILVHKARSAFINFSTREGAERAVAEGVASNGEIVIASNPLKVQWGRPRALGPNAEEQAREVISSKKATRLLKAKHDRQEARRNPAMVVVGRREGATGSLEVAPPPGSGSGVYKSQRSDYEE